MHSTASSGNDSPSRDDSQRRATAYHEASHAVLAVLFGRAIQKVSILPSKTAIGASIAGKCQLQAKHSKGSDDWIEEEAMILLAGMIGESKITGKYCMASANQDLKGLRRLASMRADGEKAIAKLERRWLDKAEHYLSDPTLWLAVELVAKELEAKDTVRARTIAHYMEQAKHIIAKRS